MNCTQALSEFLGRVEARGEAAGKRDALVCLPGLGEEEQVLLDSLCQIPQRLGGKRVVLGWVGGGRHNSGEDAPSRVVRECGLVDRESEHVRETAREVVTQKVGVELAHSCSATPVWDYSVYSRTDLVDQSFALGEARDVALVDGYQLGLGDIAER